MSTKFIQVQRREPQYRYDRTNDFKDVEIHALPDEIKEQSSRCMECGIPFCHAYGCPLGNVIPEINKAVLNGNYLEAYRLLSEKSPFPEWTARVCPALCESACCANIPSKPVNIKQIEFFVIEEAFKRGYVIAHTPRARNGKRVAVIGSGPSGLTAAQLLNMMGYEVVVFEKWQFAGGLLRYGIPDFKLEKEIIERRINLMKEEGIIFEFGVEIGVDISAKYIEKKFDAMCICIGCETPRDLNIKGRELKNIYFALDYLRSQLKFNSGENSDLEISAKDKNVLIIGGGDTGSDCLGTAIRQGASKITQIEIMPEPPKDRHVSTPWPEWEYKKRTSSSHLEGGERLWGVLTKSFEGDKNGNVKKLNASKVDWLCDSNGRPIKFSEIKNSDFEIKADLVFLSMGFVGVASKSLISELGLGLSERGNIVSNKLNQTNINKIFTCADAANGASLVVRSIYSAIKMAENVDKYLKGL